jgi:hypothetical protein
MNNDIHAAHDKDEESFLRRWSGRVWDESQLAQIEAIEASMVKYAMKAWRPMHVAPPLGVFLLCACEEGVVIMTCTPSCDWRTSQGFPHKPPRAWMPCPSPPPFNGSGRP